MASRVVNPHIQCYIRAIDEGDPTANPPRSPQLQELRMEHDLGSYTIAKLDKLLERVEEAVEAWIANNPPM